MSEYPTTGRFSKKGEPLLENPIQIFKKGFYLYLSRLDIIFPLASMAFMVWLVELLAVSMHLRALFFISVIAGIVVSYIVYVAMVRAISSPPRITLGEVLSRVEHYVLPSIVVSMLIVLAVVGGIVVFVIPGIVLAGYLLFAFFAVIEDHRLKLDALYYSWQLVRGRWIAVFWRIVVANVLISFIVWGFLMFLWSLGIGETPVETIQRVQEGDLELSISQSLITHAIDGFFTLPLSIAILHIIYKNLKQTYVPGAEDQSLSQARRYIRIAHVVGAVVFVFAIVFASYMVIQLLPEVIRLTHMPAAVISAF